jgi:hypothetical protein
MSKKLFQFTDDEHIGINMLLGDLKKISQRISTENLTQMGLAYTPTLKAEASTEMQYARIAMILQSIAQVILHDIGYFIGKAVPADVAAAFLPGMMNEICKGFVEATDGAFEIDFECKVMVDAKNHPQVAAASELAVAMLPHLAKAMMDHIIKAIKDDQDKPNRPSSSNKIV